MLLVLWVWQLPCSCCQLLLAIYTYIPFNIRGYIQFGVLAGTTFQAAIYGESSVGI
jgi:hypothetical protein